MLRRQLLTRLTLAALTCMARPIRGELQNGKLIEFGWDTPPPSYISTHIEEMEQLPFDGLVLDLKANTGPADTHGYFSWNVWGAKVIRADDYSESIDALQRIQFRRFSENFLRFNVVPGDLDWYDEDFHTVIANAALAARVAQQCHLKGILFDVEHYRGKPFHYPSQRHWKEQSFAAYQQQVKQCGREFMLALNAEYATITVLLTYGYSIALQSTSSLQAASYGLLAAFLDGMLEMVAPGTLIFDGWEAGYGYKTEQQFQNAYDIMRRRSLEWTGVQEKFRQHYRASFCLWIDKGKVWDVTDFTHNYFTPAAFEQAVHLALKHTDRYVWIYSQQAQWWAGK